MLRGGTEVVCIQSSLSDRIQVHIRKIPAAEAGPVPSGEALQPDRGFLVPSLFIEPIGAAAHGLRQYSRQSKAGARREEDE